jgi:hypothetical protein
MRNSYQAPKQGLLVAFDLLISHSKSSQVQPGYDNATIQGFPQAH